MIDRNTPTQVGTNSDWSIVAAGYNFSFGMKTNGTIWSWGNNSNGQLGFGDTISRNIPYPLGSPATPSSLTATFISPSRVDLWWADNSFNAEQSGVPTTVGETGFRIERSTDGTNYELRTTTNANITSYSDITSTVFAPNTTYYYRVQAYNTIGVSPYSNETIPSPEAPITLTAQTIYSYRIDLSWLPVAGAQDYKLERGTIAGGPYNFIGNTSTATFFSNDTELSPSTTYYYRVWAYAGGDGNPSPEANATTPPAPPAALTATAIADNLIVLSWTNVANEDSYKIERRSGTMTYYIQIGQTITDVVTYSDTTVTPSNIYYYQVRTYSATDGDSEPSPVAKEMTVLVPPDMPSALTATAIADNLVVLTWTNVANEEVYKIERGFTSGGPYTEIAQTATDVITYADTTVTPSNTYYYQVSAYNMRGTSGYSWEANTTTDLALGSDVPGVPTAIVVSSSQINLTWIDAAAETGFKIERSPNFYYGYSPIGTTGPGILTYADTGLSPTTIYYYRVRAANAGGVSNPSPYANATTLLNTPGPLTATTLSTSQIALTWTNVTNATGYYVESSSSSASGPWTRIVTPTADTITYTNTGLLSNTIYYYHVCAYNVNNAGVNSLWTSPVSATTNSITAFPPDTPGPLTATAISSTRISLTWTNVDNEIWYYIRRSSDSASGPWTWSITRTVDTTTYPNDELSANTHYYYQVCAHNDSGDSVGYATADTWTLLSAPGALTATGVSTTQINLSWTPVADNTGYTIYRGFMSGGPYTQTGTTAQNVVTYNDATVTASHTYYYRVRATNANGDGDESPEANATTAGIWSTVLSVPIDDYSVFIGCKTNGTLWIWSGSGAPSRVETGTNWSTVTAGDGLSLTPYFFARQTNGTLWSWGENSGGQLGLGNTVDRATPTQVLGASSDWSKIACGQGFTIAIKTNGTIWSCGLNNFGTLGWGTFDFTEHPTFAQEITSASNWSMVAAGVSHSIALKTNSTIWTWGNNDFGQLGDSTNIERDSPIPVGTTSDWSLITAGGYHTAAIKTDRTLWAWGANDSGQLGLGYTTDNTIPPYGVFTPTRVGTASDWFAVAGGTRYTIALKTNGSLWAWGDNSSGQLGLGDRDNRYRPNQLGSIPSPHPALTATLVSLNQMDMTWSDTNSEKEFQIWRNNSLLTTLDANVLSWSDTTITPNNTYYYRVKAVNDVGESFSGALLSLLITDTNVTKFTNTPSFPTGPLAMDWSIIKGGKLSIARKTNGTIWAWGYNSSSVFNPVYIKTPTLVGE